MEKREEIVFVKKIVSGDEKAFREFYKMFFPKIYKYAYRKLQNREQAEDITSETFFKIFKHLDTYESRMNEGLDIWVYSIERNAIRDLFRKNASVKILPLEEKWGNVLLPPIDDPYIMMERKEIEEIINEELQKIPKQYREIIKLRFFKKKHIREIAATLGKNEGAIKIMQFRALSALKEKVKERIKNANQ